MHISNCRACDVMSLLTLQNCSHYFFKEQPWLQLLLILLSNDVHQNPGPNVIHNSYFTFMNWNCNSLAKHDFHRKIQFSTMISYPYARLA